jgi:hypothetical protein
MKIISTVAIAIALSNTAFADSPYCAPKADGTDRIYRPGRPATGYFASAVAARRSTVTRQGPSRRSRERACPSRTFASGDSCEEFR